MHDYRLFGKDDCTYYLNFKRMHQNFISTFSASPLTTINTTMPKLCQFSSTVNRKVTRVCVANVDLGLKVMFRNVFKR